MRQHRSQIKLQLAHIEFRGNVQEEFKLLLPFVEHSAACSRATREGRIALDQNELAAEKIDASNGRS